MAAIEKTNPREIKLNSKSETKIVLIDGAKAIEEFSRHDLFINSMSQFDLQARLNTTAEDVTIDDYIAFIIKQILSWDHNNNKHSLALFGAIMTLNVKELLSELEFPSEIFVILTNGLDEAQAAYCRNMNLIILPINKLPLTDKPWNDTVVHELFHIWSRNNLKKRNAMYAALGYLPTPKVINLPDNLVDLKITNPDVPLTDVYIQLKMKATGKMVNLAPTLIASEKFNPLGPGASIKPEDSRKSEISTAPRGFFDFLMKKFIVLDENLESTGILVSYSDVEGLYDKIGYNSRYDISPEETLADNFVLLMKYPSPWVLVMMKTIFE